MTTIILVAIGVLLAAIAAIFVIFYGGSAFHDGDAKARADTLENAGLNVESAQQGYVAANGSLATSLDMLKGTGDSSWLKSLPSLDRVTKGVQAISTTDGVLAYTVPAVNEDACRRVNSDYRVKDAMTADIPTDMKSMQRGCYKAGTVYTYYVRFDPVDGGTGDGAAAPAQNLATSIVLRAGIASSCIQVAELEVYSGGTNVALASNGGVASGSTPYSGQAGPFNANDGVKPAGYPNIFHSQCGGGDYLQITFAKPVSVDQVKVYGRADGYQNRDVYSYQLYAGSQVISQSTVDATSGSGVSVPQSIPTPPPEPAVGTTPAAIAAYATWLTTVVKQQSTVIDPSQALANLQPNVDKLVAGSNEITGAHYENAGWYSRYGFGHPEPYVYFTIRDDVFSSFCQQWNASHPANASSCDNYYGNHFTFYLN